MTIQDSFYAEDATQLAERVMAALPELVPGVDGPLVYSRVDLIPDDAGNPVVLELELTEPSFFFALAPGSIERLVEAVVGRL